MRTWKRILIPLVLIIVFVLIISSFFKPSANNHYIDHTLTSAYGVDADGEHYSHLAARREREGIGDGETGTEVSADEYLLASGAEMLEADDPRYGDLIATYREERAGVGAALLSGEAEISFRAGVEKPGLYQLAFDFYDLEESILPIEYSLLVDGEYPFFESRALEVPGKWRFSKNDFPLDRYGNEIQPRSLKARGWDRHLVEDSARFHESFKFYLEPDSTITLRCGFGSFLLGDFFILVPEKIPSYQEYLESLEGEEFRGLLELPAENLYARNDPSLRLRSERDPSATSYHSQFLRLNAIDGASWRNGGQGISWRAVTEEAGLYRISFKYLQNTLKEMPVFREIKINGRVPYKELSAYAFPYTEVWLNRTLTGSEGEPLLVHLEKGENIIELTGVLYPYRNAVEALRSVMGEITELALEIKKLTGNADDAYRDWDIDVHIPDAGMRLENMAAEVRKIHAELSKLSDAKSPAELSNLLSAARMLQDLSKAVNKLPSRLVKLSDGDASSAQLLGDLMQRLMSAGLDLQNIYLHGEKKLPAPRANFFVRIWEGLKQLVLSFINNPYRAEKAREGELVVWVNHPRQYIEILQNLIDSEYDGPLPVRLSQMPNENKLILANATGRAPDVAIGINHWIPHEFAIRGAALDLRKFRGYEETVSKFSKGMMIPYAFEEGIYGLPETQNFWVTFYRKDILSGIGIEVPETWEEIIAILPQLQRYGMNYYLPIAMFEGMKPYVVTLPFIYQFGGTLFSADGMQTLINSDQTLEGMQLMAEFFTLYNVPKRVPNFYNHFRYGTLPIGISDLSTYLLLENTAAELDGLWDIALHPGVEIEKEEGKKEIVRYAAAGAQANMIFASTNHPEAAWHFLSWWMSTPVQVRFAYELQTTYGKMYLWNTANLEAFAVLPISEEHKDVILKQWEYALEATRIPGSYMVEREISNAWSKIVFNGANPRLALDEAARIANREILYKMEEFGYTKNGVKLKDYLVPTIENIDLWLSEVGHD